MPNVVVAGLRLAANALDVSGALLAAAWPLGAAARTRRRLVTKGFVDGQHCELTFALCFGEEMLPDEAIHAARAVRVSVTDLTSAPFGRVTVQVPARVRRFDLSLTARRMRRLAAACGGHARVLGPIAPNAAAAMAARCAASGWRAD